MQTTLHARSVISLGLCDSISVEFIACTNSQAISSLKHATNVAILCGIVRFINAAIWSLIFWYAGQLMQTGDWSVTNILQSMAAVIFSAQYSGIYLYLCPPQAEATIAAREMHQLLTEISLKQVISPRCSVVDPEIKGSIKFDNVSFSYPSRPDIRALKSVSFEIAAGQRAAFVGPSGSGLKMRMSSLQLEYCRKIDNHCVAGASVRYHIRPDSD